MTPEGKVKAAVKAILKRRGIWFFMPQNYGLGSAGIPDFICCVPLTKENDRGKLLGIETKAFGKRNNTTALQDIQLAAIQSANGWSIVVDDPKQLEDFLNDSCPAAQGNCSQGGAS